MRKVEMKKDVCGVVVDIIMIEGKNKTATPVLDHQGAGATPPSKPQYLCMTVCIYVQAQMILTPRANERNNISNATKVVNLVAWARRTAESIEER